MAKKILLFGGSFDPPHIGHQRLLAAALREIKPDRTYIAPAFCSPFKVRHHASVQDRLNMAKLLAESVAGRGRPVIVHPFELRRKRKTYTYETLRYFRSLHPDAEFWFLVGSDAFSDLDRWKRVKELKASCCWVTGRRPGAPPPRKILAHILNKRLPPISSTEIRCRCLADLSVKPWMLDSILDYIRRKDLYGLGIHKELRRTLPPERYRHTVSVTRLALQLAKTHRLNPETAALAGLLHDCGRALEPLDMLRYVRRQNVKVPALGQIAKHAPVLAHAYVGADLAQRHFKVQDKKILRAIGNHTLGIAGMAALDRLLYVADVSSEDRDFPQAGLVRRLARHDLDAALVEAVRSKLQYVADRRQWIHPQTAELWNWLRLHHEPAA